MTMYREKRFEEIKRLLAEKNELSIEDVMQAVGVSRDTARRDIVALDAAGIARRTRGGLVSLTFGHTIPSYSTRQKLFSAEKSAMADKALTLIHPGGIYFIDDSTALLKLSQNLNEKVTVYTHSLDNAIALSVKTDVTLKLLGGQLNHHARFFFEPASLDALRKIAFDAAFIGATSLSEAGVFSAYDTDAQIKAAVAESAQQLVVVTETQKLQIQAPYQGFDLKQIDTLITDRKLPHEATKWFGAQTELIIAE